MWRNRNRTLISMAAIFFAVLLSVLTSSLKDGIFENLVKNVVSFYTGYVQVHKQGYWDEQILDNSFEINAAIEQKIVQHKNIDVVTYRLESFALASAKDVTKGSMVVGIQPEKEDQVTFLSHKLIQGRYITNHDTDVLLANGLATRLKLLVGDTILLIGQGYHGATAAGKYPVKGIVKFGSPELNDKALFMPLAAAQDFYDANGMATSLVLSLKNTKGLDPAAAGVRSKLGAGYEVMTWSDMIPEVKQHIEADSNNLRYIQGILYMLICFGIFGTLLMMMVERKFEMGMLVAIGLKKNKLIILLMIESVFTVLAGCMLGIIASIPLVYYLNSHPIRIGGETAKAYERFGFEAVFPASVEASNFIYQGLIVLSIGLLLSLYPMFRVLRLNPVTAMKR